MQGESTCPICIFVCFLAVKCAFSIYYESNLSTVVPAQFYLFSRIINSYFSSHESQVSLCSVTACIWHWDMRWTILLFYFAIWNCTQKYLIKQYSRTNTFQNTSQHISFRAYNPLTCSGFIKYFIKSSDAGWQIFKIKSSPTQPLTCTRNTICLPSLYVFVFVHYL